MPSASQDRVGDDAALVSYATNTFAFTSGHNLDLFVSKKLLPQQRQAIKRIQTSGILLNHNLKPRLSVQPSAVLSLHSLRAVVINLKYQTDLLYSGLPSFFGFDLTDSRVMISSSSMMTPEGRRCYGQCRHERQSANELEDRLKADNGQRAEVRRLIEEKKNKQDAKRKSSHE